MNTALRVGRSSVRRYVTAADKYGSEFAAERAHVSEHARGSANFWRKVSFYIALPVAAITYANARNIMSEHHEHLEHLKEENGGEMPSRIRYPYLNKRDKPFPWGMQSLFHGPNNMEVEEE